MVLMLCCLCVTVSELWLPLIGSIKTPGTLLKRNRKEIRVRDEVKGKRKEYRTEKESGRSDSRLALQGSGEWGVEGSAGILTIG